MTTRIQIQKRYMIAMASMIGMWVLQAGALSTNVWSSVAGGSGPVVGNGPWDTSTANWWASGTAATWNNDGTAIANFAAAGGASSTVTLSGSLSAAGLRFPSNDVYMLTGAGTLALATSGTVSYAGDTKVTISNVLSGSDIRFSMSSGTSEKWISLSGSNLLTGTTSLGSSVRVTVNNNAAFGTSTIDCGTVGGVYLNTTGTFTNDIRIGYNGASNGRGPLRFEKSGLTLSGTLTLLANASITTISANRTVTIAGPIIETGTACSLTFGGGYYTLTGACTYSGVTTLSGGAITLAGGDNRLPETTSVTNNGTLVLVGISQTFAGLSGSAPNAAVVGGSNIVSSLVLNFASGTNTFNGMIGGGGANQNNLSLTKSGAGTQVLSNTNTYTGATTVNAGTLAITNDVKSATWAVSNNATLIVNGPLDLSAPSRTLTIATGGGTAGLLRVNGNLTLGGTLTVSAANEVTAQVTLAECMGGGTISGGAGSFSSTSLPTNTLLKISNDSTKLLLIKKPKGTMISVF
jgi:autotransporter-associated beta strand protein